MPVVNYQGKKLRFPNTMGISEIETKLKAMAYGAKGAGETALTMGSAALAAPVAGLAGISAGVRGAMSGEGFVDPAVERINQAFDGFTYKPSSAGQSSLGALGEAYDKVVNYRGLAGGPTATEIGEYWREDAVPAMQETLGDEAGSGIGATAIAMANLLGPPGSSRVNRSMMGVNKSKRRVGTTGKYVGAPSDVDSPQKLAQMRKKYSDAMEIGVDGADWYDDASDYIQRVTPSKYNPGQMADTIGVTSQGTGVDSNLGFTIKGVNQRAVGDAVNTGRFPGNQSPLIELILDGKEPDLGPKRTPFAQNTAVAWDPDRAIHPVHDIWDGRAYGYKHPDGKPWDAGFSPQQHAFMDEEAATIIANANKRGLGGRQDWDPLKAQAAAWTGAKINAGDIKPDEAAMHYGSYGNKYVANATGEQIPGAGTGHLDGIVDAPFDERSLYHRDPRSSWENAAGQDGLYSSAGVLTDQTLPMVGAYTPQGTGMLEINQGSVARPLVQMEDGPNGRQIRPGDRSILNTVEGSRAYLDVQNAGAWHKMLLGGKAGDQTGVFASMDGSPTPEVMAQLNDIASRNGMFVSDTGRGVSFINDVYSDAGKARTGATLGKDLKAKDGLGAQIRAVLGDDAKVDRVMIDSDYLDYENLWQEGGATQRFVDDLDALPTVRDNIEPELRRKAQANMERDADASVTGGRAPREDVQRARQILSEGGLAGLKEALKKGVILPAVAYAAMLVPSEEQETAY